MYIPETSNEFYSFNCILYPNSAVNLCLLLDWRNPVSELLNIYSNDNVDNV